MTQSRAERRRLDREAQKADNGAAGKSTDDGIDGWLLGDSPEASDPMPIHRFQVSVSDYQRANNTRYSARRQLQVARDLDDEQMIASARIEGRRARALMDAAFDGITESWPAISEAQRNEWHGTLPDEIKAFLASETGDRTPVPEGQPD